MFTHRRWKWIAAVLLSPGSLLPAAGDALGEYLAQHGYIQMRMENSGRNQDLVQVGVNGSSATLAVDTGCSRTCITNGFARKLKLDVQKVNPVVGVGGKLAGSGIALLNSFTLNNSEINRTSTIQVLPSGATSPKDGLLGYDYMRLNAVLLPVGRSFFLYKPGPAPPAEIDSYMKTLGFQPIPLTFGEGGLRATGSLNGHPLVALVDCGANFTLFDSAFVKTTVGALVFRSRMVSWGLDGRPMFMGVFRADKLTFGGLTFPPTTTTTASGTTLNAVHAQALLGYDLLAAHKAIIDLGHDVLWMK